MSIPLELPVSQGDGERQEAHDANGPGKAGTGGCDQLGWRQLTTARTHSTKFLLAGLEAFPEDPQNDDDKD